MPLPDPAICHRAIATRDARFDGVFFFGVTSTGIYCRTVCRARRPKAENCRFFLHPASAELAGFRPCRLCCPEQAPGFAPVDAAAAFATVAVKEIESGALGDGESLDVLADRLGITPRHLRRVVGAHLGVSPVELAQTQRLLLAKRLLAETRLPIGEIALASGFRSLRRCNALFKSRYGLPPSAFRKTTTSPPADTGRLGLFLAYRPPFAWPELMRYFMGRAIPGVEHITPDRYARTFRSGPHAGWLAVTHEPSRHGVRLALSNTLAPALPAVLAAVRRSFDLDASPHEIAAVLGPDPLLAESVRDTPGLRLPGAIDAFETAVRTIIGQQVSVTAATTVMGRVVQAFGEPLATPWPELSRLTLTPGRLARESVDTLAPLGLNSARARALLTISQAIESGHLTLDRTADPERAIARLQELPGIGPWTAHYFGMRILAWPDAFIAGDLVIKKALAPLTLKQIEARSAAWRPWRGYAVMHLWRSAGFFKNPASPLPP